MPLNINSIFSQLTHTQTRKHTKNTITRNNSPTSPDDEMAVIDAATVESVLGGGAAAAPSILAE